MKYIGVDALKKEIERLIKQNDSIKRHSNTAYCIGYEDAFVDLLHSIDSLQKEPRFPQENNIVEKVFGAGNLESWEYREAEMLVALAKEELLKSLQQEQPEVDIEKEYTEFVVSDPVYSKLVNGIVGKSIARHFYELGKTRKEE